MQGSKRIIKGRGRTAVYELRVSTGKDPVTGKYRQVSRIWPGYAADDPSITSADKALAKLVKEAEDDRSGRNPGKGTTVDQLLAKWMKQITSLGRSPTTLREYQRLIEKRISPAIGGMLVTSVTALELDEFYQRLTADGLSPASVRQVHAVIRAAFRQGVKWRFVAYNPAVDASPGSLTAKVVTAPTVDEVRRMIEAAESDDHDMAALIAIAAVTGARRGELCGLRWGDVNWEELTITFSRSVAVMKGGNMISKDTKTHQARTLSLDEFGEAILRRLLGSAQDRADDLGIEVTDLTPIFTYNLVTPIPPDTVTHYVKRIAERAGVDTHLHALRHFAATELVGGGHDIRTVAGRLGHRDASVTLKVYAHARPAQDREAANYLGRALTSGAARKA